MKRFENIQIGKLTSAYGGVGSIVETKDNGSILIGPFDQWPFYVNYINTLIRKIRGLSITATDRQRKIPVAEASLLNDRRLIKRLHDYGYSSLKELFMPPVLESNGYTMDGDDQTKTLMSDYFPKWFFCPKCRKLSHFDEWRRDWNQRFPNNQDPYVFDRNVPSCSNCSSQLGNNRYRRKDLEQVRFVLASMDNGAVLDLPWDRIINGQIDQHGEFSEFNFDTAHAIPQTDLKYSTSARTDSLYGIRVNEGNQSKNLGQVERLNFIDQHNHAYRMYIKNSTNIYFSNTVSSIYIPKFVPTEEEVDRLSRKWNNFATNERNAQTLSDWWQTNAEDNDLRQIPFEVIESLISANFNLDALFDYSSEENFIKDEYDFITNEDNYSQDPVYSADDFISEKISYEDGFYNSVKIKALYCIHKLKETTAQTSYQRIDNSADGKEWYDAGQHRLDSKTSAARPTCSIAIDDIVVMPAVECFGEGMFLEFDADVYGANVDIERALHTYSHIIMKELEFECGYSLTSMKERLYFLPEHRIYGILIYSINGSDSSYGGITSLFPDKIRNIIQNALERANDCPNDPICESEDGHCFACTDLPETSCQLFNDDLSRIELLNAF